MRLKQALATMGILAAAVMGAACDDDDGMSGSDAASGGSGGAANLSDAGTGGTSGTGGTTDGAAGSDGGAGDGAVPSALAPPAAGKGIQITMTDTIEPGVDTERCMFYKVGAEPLNMVKQLIEYTPGSHHLLIYLTPYTDIPTKTLGGQTIDTTGVFPCGTNGPTGDWDVTNLVGGAQIAKGAPSIDGFPAGTAIKIPAGAVLLVNSHYLNAGETPLVTKAYINIYTIPAAEVTQEAGILFFYNPIIRVPSLGEAVARQRCPIKSDINLVGIESHMHRRGIGYVANSLNPGTGAAEELFKTDKWADIETKILAPARSVKAGQLIDYTCSYKNTENRLVLQGRTTKDEMCVFAAPYYPRDLKSEYCSMTDDIKGRYLGGLWVGSGIKTGAETAGCFMAAQALEVDKGDSFYGCVIDSCPKISKETSDVARCLISKGLGMCGTECSTDPTACKTCISTKCGGYFGTLAAAACQ